MADLRKLVLKAARSADPLAGFARLRSQHDPVLALRLLAALQDGQFGTRQARALGVARSRLQRMAAGAEIHNASVGVWRFTTAVGMPDVAVTAWLRCWPHAIVSHWSAAHAHGLADAPSQPSLTIPHTLRRAPAGIVVHRSRTLPGKDRHWIEGVAYMSVARTVCDLADPDDIPASLVRLDNAVAAGARRAWIHQRATALAPGRPGVQAIRDATTKDAAQAFRSWLERVTDHLWHIAGFPLPQWNQRVRDRRGLVGIVDCRWPGDVLAELEGLRFHTTPSQRRRDAERFNRFLAAGCIVRRFTWRDVVERPLYVVTTMGEALRAGGVEVDLAGIPATIALPPSLLRIGMAG